MSGLLTTTVVVVGVLALLALVGVLGLLAQVRALRRELTAASQHRGVEEGPAPVDPAATPAVPAVHVVSATVTADRDIGVVDAPPLRAPSDRQIVLATAGHPLVRVAALIHGLRQALRPQNRDRISALMHRDLARRQKQRRQAARRAARALTTDAAAAPTASVDRPDTHRDLAS